MTNTAKVLKTAVESGLYSEGGFMCLVVFGMWDESKYLADWYTHKSANVIRKLFTDGLGINDLRRALDDVRIYCEGLEPSYLRLIDSMTELGGRETVRRKSEIVRILSPLYLDWDNRPQTREEVGAYLEKHYDQPRS